MQFCLCERTDNKFFLLLCVLVFGKDFLMFCDCFEMHFCSMKI